MTTIAAFRVGLTEAANIFNTGPTEAKISLRSPCAIVNEFIAIMNNAVNCSNASMHNQESMATQCFVYNLAARTWSSTIFNPSRIGATICKVLVVMAAGIV